MESRNCLVITCGYFGDIIFATSLADKLKSEMGYVQVDYLIGFPQVQRLVANNPFIDNVYLSIYPSAQPVNTEIEFGRYSRVVKLNPLHYLETPAVEYQRYVGLQHLTSNYKVYTEPTYDKVAREYVESIREGNKKVVALMSNWESKTYSFSVEQYRAGVDTPTFGYGGKHRDIQKVITALQEACIFVEVGVPAEYNQIMTATLDDSSEKSLVFEASLIKSCDLFLGTDGGLATIAAGVGTRTVLTGDFNLQLYGWNGVLKKIDIPKLGPYEYFGDPHIVLDPYLTDDELIQSIVKLL